MGNSNLSGIEGFFNDLDDGKSIGTSDQVDVRGNVIGEQAGSRKSSRKKNRRPATGKVTSAREIRTEPVRLPTGRPPGKTDADGPRRTKASLWLDSDLLDEYRERVYVERRHLGELVESALREYKTRNW